MIEDKILQETTLIEKIYQSLEVTKISLRYYFYA